MLDLRLGRWRCRNQRCERQTFVNLRIPVIVISQSGRSWSPKPVIVIMLLTWVEEVPGVQHGVALVVTT